MLAMVGGTTGCGDADHPRDDEITSTIESLWDAVGVDDNHVTTSPYARDTRRDTRSCADLPEDDRWIAFRTSQLPGEQYNQDQLWERSNQYLDDNNFEVVRYSDTRGDRYALRSEKDEMALYFDVLTNGYAHLRVVSGPCATRMGHEPPPGMVPID